MKSVTALLAVRDTLRTYLTDPFSYAGGSARSGTTWIFYDEPLGIKYPMIEIIKLDNPTTVISIGPDYWEREYVIANVWVKAKNGFKVTINGIDYLNAQLVEYYLAEVKETLKTKFSTLWGLGAKGYHHIKTTPIKYDDCTQTYMAAVIISVQYFNR